MEAMESENISKQDEMTNKRMFLGGIDSTETDELSTDPAPQFTKDKSSNANLKAITRQHWQSARDRTSCYNPSCHIPFSLLLRHHHCRRCGEVFCENCVRYLSRLNKLAQPDPDGKMRKVCADCYKTGIVATDGQIRSHTNDFSAMRVKRGNNQDSSVASIDESAQKFDQQCERLLKGFEKEVGSSEIKRTIQEMKQGLKKPEWMKASPRKREKNATGCQVCEVKFDRSRQKRSCYVCGKCVCKSCSSKDLLIYIPDEKTDDGEKGKIKMSIIRIVGCPEIEPAICLYLRVCPVCKNKVIDKQVQVIEEEVKPSTQADEDFMSQLNNLHEMFQRIEYILERQMADYKKMVEIRRVRRQKSIRKAVNLLIQIERDLSQNLDQYMHLFEQLKRLKPVTPAQVTLFDKYKRTKSQFYLDNRSLFEAVKRRLTDTVPPQQSGCMACMH